MPKATATTAARRAAAATAAAFVAYAGVFIAFATTASPSLRDFRGTSSVLALPAVVQSLRRRVATRDR